MQTLKCQFIDLLQNIEAIKDKELEFIVEFIKRSTGEKRVMKCKKDISDLCKGGTAKYHASSQWLILVRDVEKNAIRTIPRENILSLQIGDVKLIAD